MKKRPPKKTIDRIMTWLNEQDINFYTGCADLDTGQQYYGLMDIDSADEAIKIYELNKKDAWIEPSDYS